MAIRIHSRIWLCGLLASLAVNLALTGALARRIHIHPGPDRQSATTPRLPDPQPSPTVPTPTGRMLEGTNAIPFHWAMLESDDYQTYIADLRAVGCPEPVVRDLIAAELKELYAAQDRSGSSGLAFWAHGEQRQRETRELEFAREARAAECREVYTALLGVDWPAEQIDDVEDYVLLATFLGFLPPERRLHVVALLEELDASAERVVEEARHLILQEDQARLLALYAEWRTGVSAHFSPAEIEELSLRAGVLRLDPSPDALEGLQLTGAELRQILQILWGDADPHFASFGQRHNLSPRLDPDDQIRDPVRQQRIVHLLGPGRGRVFLRNLDPDFSPLREFTLRHRLPEEVTHRLYQTQKVAQGAVAELRADPSLSSDDYTVQAALVLATYEATLRRNLAPDLVVECLNLTTGWRQQSLQHQP